MTKKEKLVWRIKEMPSAEGVARLVEQKVITAEEGRQILFSEGSKKENEALKEEIKFLRVLVDRLAVRADSHLTIYHEYERWKPVWPTWYKYYGPIMQTYATAGSFTVNSSTASGVGATTFAINNTGNTVKAANMQTRTSTITPKGLSSLN